MRKQLGGSCLPSTYERITFHAEVMIRMIKNLYSTPSHRYNVVIIVDGGRVIPSENLAIIDTSIMN